MCLSCNVTEITGHCYEIIHSKIIQDHQQCHLLLDRLDVPSETGRVDYTYFQIKIVNNDSEGGYD